MSGFSSSSSSSTDRHPSRGPSGRRQPVSDGLLSILDKRVYNGGGGRGSCNSGGQVTFRLPCDTTEALSGGCSQYDSKSERRRSRERVEVEDPFQFPAIPLPIFRRRRARPGTARSSATRNRVGSSRLTVIGLPSRARKGRINLPQRRVRVAAGRGPANRVIRGFWFPPYQGTWQPLLP